MPKNVAVRIEIENLLGLEKLTIEPGPLTIISGDNGVGKTSTLSAIRWVCSEGEDPSILRDGAEKGFVRIALSDGTVIERSIRRLAGGATKSELSVRHPKLGKISRGRAVVDSLVDELGTDPLALLTAPEKEQLRILLEVLPLDLPDSEIEEAAGKPIPGLVRGTALDKIAVLRKELYDERTGLNRDAKEKRSTVAQLRETLPADEPEPVSVASLAEERAAIEAKRQREVTAIESEAGEFRRSLEKHTDQARERVKEDAQRRIDEIRAEADRRVQEVKDEAQAQADGLSRSAAKELEESNAKEKEQLGRVGEAYGPKLVDVGARIAAAEESAKAAGAREKTRQLVAELETAAENAEAGAEFLTGRIGALDSKKASLLSKLPVAGLEVLDGRILLDGHPLHRANTARQYELVFSIAKLRAKEVPLLVSDHFEYLGPANKQAFVAAAEALGMTVIVAERTSGPLKVETLGKAEVAA